MRAADDLKHAEFLNQLRSSSTSTSISNESLSVLKSLTKEDIEKNNSWTQATIVVTSNEERCRINEQQSKALSKRNNCPRILWNKPIDGIVANSLTLEDTNYIYNNYTQFTGVFVKGAPAYLQDNINPRRGLSNGTPITLHSLVLDPYEDVHRVLRKLMQPNEDDVRLQYNPLFVLVKLPHANPDDFIGLNVGENESSYPIRYEQRKQML